MFSDIFILIALLRIDNLLCVCECVLCLRISVALFLPYDFAVISMPSLCALVFIICLIFIAFFTIDNDIAILLKNPEMRTQCVCMHLYLFDMDEKTHKRKWQTQKPNFFYCIRRATNSTMHKMHKMLTMSLTSFGLPHNDKPEQ